MSVSESSKTIHWSQLSVRTHGHFWNPDFKQILGSSIDGLNTLLTIGTP